MALSRDQVEARDKLHKALAAGKLVSLLAGPAGSGKTTLMRTFREDLLAAGRGVRLIAPTGKAAVRLGEVSGSPAETVHSALYRQVHQAEDGSVSFGAPGWPCEPGEVLLCDEASMVGKTIHDELVANLPPGAQLVYVGDREQLAPVGDPWGPDFARPTALLTEVHRQALESPIVRLATEVRERDPDWDWRRWDGWDGEQCRLARPWRPEKAAGWLSDLLSRGEDATLLAFTNKARQDLNARVRSKLGMKGDPQAGEVLVCLRNNRALGVMNGETRELGDVQRIPGGPWPCAAVTFRGSARTAWVRPDLLDCGGDEWYEFTKKLRRSSGDDGDRSALFMHAAFGYCLTVHKAQGSEWDHVGFAHATARWFLDKEPEDYRRLRYTAVTRAAKTLTVFE